ncbi:hypothetical protein D3C80_1278640 [compost metagenome]
MKSNIGAFLFCFTSASDVEPEPGPFEGLDESNPSATRRVPSSGLKARLGGKAKWRD